jgi:hypothetical protein
MQVADLRRSKVNLCARRQSPLSNRPSSAWLVGLHGLSRIELFAHSVETELVNYGRTEIWRASNVPNRARFMRLERAKGKSCGKRSTTKIGKTHWSQGALSACF